MSQSAETHDVDPDRRECLVCGKRTLAVVRDRHDRQTGYVYTHYRCTDLDCHDGGTVVVDQGGDVVNMVGRAVDESFRTTGGQPA